MSGFAEHATALMRFLCRLMRVNCLWLLSLKFKNFFSGKIKVGFGPVVTGERTLQTRKWWIDPIVDGINRGDSHYVADIFFEGEDLSRFDIVVLVKTFDFISDKILLELKRKGTVFIYAIVDNPAGCRRGYDRESSFLSYMDGFIICNPLQQLDIVKYSVPFCYVNTPNINLRFKHGYNEKDTLIILWEGMRDHKPYMKSVEKVIHDIASGCRKKIQLVYFTNYPGQDYGLVKQVKWKLSRREEILCSADIAVTVKPDGNKYQRRKPATKVLTYMAAGLPVVCTPSDADKLVIEHGVTGFFANSDDEWKYYLEKLIDDPALRKRIGTAGREFVSREFSIEKTATRYVYFFDRLFEGRAADGE